MTMAVLISAIMTTRIQGFFLEGAGLRGANVHHSFAEYPDVPGYQLICIMVCGLRPNQTIRRAA
jgi:hypothetical protein